MWACEHAQCKYINISISDSLLGLEMRLVKGMSGEGRACSQLEKRLNALWSQAAGLLCPAALTLKS